MSRREPISDTPPARYRAWNTVANDESWYVPGTATSPITFTWMVRIWPSVTRTCDDGLSPETPAYLRESTSRIFRSASAMVSPFRYTGPIWLTIMLPSGVISSRRLVSLAPQMSTITSSPGPSR